MLQVEARFLERCQRCGPGLTCRAQVVAIGGWQHGLVGFVFSFAPCPHPSLQNDGAS